MYIYLMLRNFCPLNKHTLLAANNGSRVLGFVKQHFFSWLTAVREGNILVGGAKNIDRYGLARVSEILASVSADQKACRSAVGGVCGDTQKNGLGNFLLVFICKTAFSTPMNVTSVCLNIGEHNFWHPKIYSYYDIVQTCMFDKLII